MTKRQLIIPNKLDKWPNQWNYHILNTFDLFFDSSKKINFIDAISYPCASFAIAPPEIRDLKEPFPELRLAYNDEEIKEENLVKVDMEEYKKNLRNFIDEQDLYSVELRLYFEINTFYYMVSISYAGLSQVFATLWYVTRIKTDTLGEDFKDKAGLNNMDTIMAVFPVGQGYENSAYNLASSIDKYILLDYEKRKNGGDNGGGDDSDPIFPDVPSDSLDLNPVGDIDSPF